MRVTPERNMAFADQPTPIAPSKVKGLKATEALPHVDLEFDLGVRAGLNSKIAGPRVADVESATGALRVTVSEVPIGHHSLPKSILVEAHPPIGNRSTTFDRALVTEGFLPPHLDRKPIPKDAPKELLRPRLEVRGPGGRSSGGSQPTTIFPPDDRRIFFDTSYPWCTCGQVQTPTGFGSGVMVGPRHLLTVSHAIDWQSHNNAGWVKFTPMLFDTSEPFGEAWGTTIYSKRKNKEGTLGWIDEQYDYVAVVLDRRIGDLTGWMGSRGYTDSWDGGKYWTHVGYPGDVGASVRPTWQTDIALDGIWYELDSHEAMSHSADVWPGQSGGPMFGWWSDEAWPSAVAVQSTQNRGENKTSGGQDMVDLILKARKDFP